MLQLITEQINNLLTNQTRVVMAIDGDCAAGKTTLAKHLATIYDCDIVHVDDFFLQPHQRTQERLAQAGGNLDYERLLTDVLEKLTTNQAFSYHPFNCKTLDFDQPVQLLGKQLTIIEGSYSQHPLLAKHYDLKVFLTVNADEQLTRILARNGKLMLERFKNEWIPREKEYAAVFKIPEQSDILLHNLVY